MRKFGSSPSLSSLSCSSSPFLCDTCSHLSSIAHVLTHSSLLAKRQATNPETDIYPVSNDGSGVKPFLPEDMNTVAKAAIAGSAQEEKRQTGEVESDTYPVENDESGVKPL